MLPAAAFVVPRAERKSWGARERGKREGQVEVSVEERGWSLGEDVAVAGRSRRVKAWADVMAGLERRCVRIWEP
jgi:hypothetical protein